jgi:hypothetical protein
MQLPRILIISIAYFIDIFAHSLLTLPVLIIFVFLTVITISLKMDTAIGSFLSIFAFVNPKLAEKAYSLSVPDIMQIFAVIGFIFFTIKITIAFIAKRLFNKTIALNLRQRIVIVLAAITFVFIAALCMIPFMDAGDIGKKLAFIPIFFVFYLLALFPSMLYVLLDYASAKIREIE